MDTNGKFWKRVISSRRQALANSETSSDAGRENILAKKPSYQSQGGCCNCCTCYSGGGHDREDRSLVRKQSCTSNQSDSLSSNPGYREELEAKITNEEMNEKLSYDSHKTSKRQAEDLASLIQEFSSYAQSLDVRYKAAERIQKILREIVPEQITLNKRKDFSTTTLPLKIKDIHDKCSKNTDLPLSFYKKCDEFIEQYKLHNEATMNFSNFLKNEKMSHIEMRQLDLEYDKLRKQFNESKTSVSSQLSNIISEKSEVIKTCVDNILPLLSDMIDQDEDIYNMLNSFSSESSREYCCSPCTKSQHEKCVRRQSDSKVICKNSKSRRRLGNNECSF